MKLRTILALALLTAVLPATAADSLTETLQKGLFEEEANRNLPAAIEAYQAIIAPFEKDREVAATTIFRLAECYRKLGRTNEAVVQYQRIVREFGDQTPLVALSQKQLSALASRIVFQDRLAEIVERSAAATRPPDEELREIQRIEEMIKNSPDLINALALSGSAPLHDAAIKGQIQVCQFLLER